MAFYQVPIGFGMTLAMNQAAMNAYAVMTEVQKREILARAHHARSRHEMQQIVNDIAK